MEAPRSSNRISDIVKLKQKLKKWRKQAHSSNSASTSDDTSNNNNNNSNNYSNFNNSNSNSNSSNTNSNSNKKGSLSRSNSMKGITFLKRTLSFTDVSTAKVSSNAVPKGFVAVHVGEEMKRFVIPMSYLSHEAFSLLLKEAEEEFGFQQEGVLRFPCEVELFESILKVVEAKNNPLLKQAPIFSRNDVIVCGSVDSQSLSHSHHPPSPMCR